MSRREPHFLVTDIIEAGNKIISYTADLSFDDFVGDDKTIDAVIRNFEIIGEASKNLPDFIKEKYQDIPWQEMYYLRNKVTHEYFGIDYEIIWDVAVNYLPVNKNQIGELIENELKGK